MTGKRFVQAAAIISLLAAGLLLSGCASKSADTTAEPLKPADAKMGNDYGKGVAAAHAARQQAGGASPASSHP